MNYGQFSCTELIFGEMASIKSILAQAKQQSRRGQSHAQTQALISRLAGQIDRVGLSKKARASVRRDRKTRGRKQNGPGQGPRNMSCRPVLSIYDPYNPIPPPVLFSIGKAIAQKSVSVLDISSNGDNWTGAIFGIVADSNFIGRTFTGTPTLLSTNAYTSFFGENSTGGGPTQGKAARIGVEILNTTKRLDLSGLVHVAIPDQRLGTSISGFTNTTYDSFCQTQVAAPYAKTFTGASLSDHPAYFFAHPLAQSDYDNWTEWQGNDLSLAGWDQAYTIAGTLSRPMSPILIMIPPSSTVNTYRLRVTAEWYHRYAASDSRISLMRNVQTSSAAAINHDRDAVEAHNSSHSSKGSFRQLGPVKGFEKSFSTYGPQWINKAVEGSMAAAFAPALAAEKAVKYMP